MFVEFFLALRAAGLPVSLREFLTLQEAMRANLAGYDVEQFYFLARTILVKDERFLDRFDQVFGRHFQGAVSAQTTVGGPEAVELPEEWLRKLAEKFLSPEEMAKIEAVGDWDTLMERLRQRLDEQQGRHQGGSKWIGTAGTSPFGAYGYNPEGIRIGQGESRHRRGVKVWDKRDFRDFSDTVEIGTRNIKVALRRLRRFARDGAATELDLPGTIGATARNGGALDLQMVPERHNAVRVLLCLDVGGSMDDHVRLCEELFSAARSEFKHLEHFYFHNCPYEHVWKSARMRPDEGITLSELMRTYGPKWKLVMVGDASMSPYELTQAGGAISHWSRESGIDSMRHLLASYPRAVWLNPVGETNWGYTESIRIVRNLMEDRMFPLTLDGLDRAMRSLMR